MSARARWVSTAGWVAVVLGAMIVGGAAPVAAQADGVSPVRMVDDEFSPKVVEVPAGGTLQFSNLGRNEHNAVAVDGSWSTIDAGGGNTPRGESVQVRVGDEPQAVRFYCTLHGSPDGAGMAGVAVIGDVPAEEVAELSGVDRRPPVPDPTGRTVQVPEDHPTIQAAVDDANPGDLVLVGPGIYHEDVEVRTPSLTIRGTDRNEVVLDGEFTRANGIAVYEADGVALENLTARNFTLNGFYWTGVEGFRGVYLTAVNNADYGIYAFNATDGVIAHSYASGSPDAGIYVGQCEPCRIVVHDILAERNGMGYSGTNAGGELYLVSSVWRHNRGGLVPNSLDSELNPPQRETTIVANLVHDNSNRDAPGKPFAHLAEGTGIVIGGGVDNLVARNVVVNHSAAGIVVAPLPDRNIWLSRGNVVRDNTVAGSGLADIALVGPSGGGNCFSANRYTRERPAGLQRLAGCDGWRLPVGWDLSATTTLLSRQVESRDVEPTLEQVGAVAHPPPQPQMPDAPVRPALDEFDRFDEVDLTQLDDIPLPDGADAVVPTLASEVTVSGLDVTAPSAWQLLFGLYAYLLPFALLAAWMALAFWDLARREDLGRGAKLGWTAAVLLVPFLGVIGYHAVSRSPIPGWLRAAFVAGGMLAYLAIVGVAAAVGGVL